MKLSKLELVRGIQELLSDESKWCKGTDARTKHGLPISPLEDAASFCIYGAARRVAKLGLGQIEKARIGAPFWDVMVNIGQYDPYRVSTGNIGVYNDTHTFAEIQSRLKEVEAKYMKEAENGIDVVAG
jgi:hypothetical protein